MQCAETFIVGSNLDKVQSKFIEKDVLNLMEKRLLLTAVLDTCTQQSENNHGCTDKGK